MLQQKKKEGKPQKEQTTGGFPLPGQSAEWTEAAELKRLE